MPETVRVPTPERDWEPLVRRFTLPSRLLYDHERRLDATAYADSANRAIAELEASPLPKALFGSLCGTIWHPVQNQARSNFKRIYTKPEHGVPFVSTRSMFFLPLRPKRFLSRLMPKLGDLMVPEGWLLLSRSGTVGNVLFVNRTLARCAISDHAMRIEPKGAPAGFLYAFLASSYGQSLIAKGVYGATVDELEPRHLASMPVPLVPEPLRDAIHDKIVSAYALRDSADGLFAQADEELHTLLGVSPFREEDVEYVSREEGPRAFVITSAEIGSRLDASRHVPVARSAVHKLEHARFKLARLGDLVGPGNVDVAPRFVRIYVDREHGTPLLQGSQLPMMRPYGLRYISTSMTPRLQRWVIRPGWVLVTCSGTIGRVGVSTWAQDGWAASQHIMRIIPPLERVHPGFLAAFLSTAFGQHQLTSRIYGGVVDELTAEDAAAVMVPNVPFDEQRGVGDTIMRAYDMRDEANLLEDRAIAELEAAIRGEAVGPEENRLVGLPDKPREDVAPEDMEDAKDREIAHARFNEDLIYGSDLERELEEIMQAE